MILLYYFYIVLKEKNTGTWRMTGYQKLWLLATYGTPQAIPKRRGGSIFAMRKTPSSFCEIIGPEPASEIRRAHV